MVGQSYGREVVALDAAGEIAWTAPIADACVHLGADEVVASTAGMVRGLAVDTGAARWSLAVPDSLGNWARSCDLDGDGRPELLVQERSTLACYAPQDRQRRWVREVRSVSGDAVGPWAILRQRAALAAFDLETGVGASARIDGRAGASAWDAARQRVVTRSWTGAS